MQPFRILHSQSLTARVSCMIEDFTWGRAVERLNCKLREFELAPISTRAVLRFRRPDDRDTFLVDEKLAGAAKRHGTFMLLRRCC